MGSTIAIHPGNGLDSFGGCVVAGVNGPFSRSLFPSILLGRVPSFHGSRRKMALVGEVVLYSRLPEKDLRPRDTQWTPQHTTAEGLD